MRTQPYPPRFAQARAHSACPFAGLASSMDGSVGGFRRSAWTQCGLSGVIGERLHRRCDDARHTLFACLDTGVARFRTWLGHWLWCVLEGLPHARPASHRKGDADAGNTCH